MDKLTVEISDCINRQDLEHLLKLLKSKVSPFKGVIDKNIEWYMAQLTQEKESKLVIIWIFSTKTIFLYKFLNFDTKKKIFQ